MSNVILKRCPLCSAKLKRKITVRKEVVFDHPRNGCKYEWDRVRGYKESIEAWNRRCSDV